MSVITELDSPETTREGLKEKEIGGRDVQIWPHLNARERKLARSPPKMKYDSRDVLTDSGIVAAAIGMSSAVTFGIATVIVPKVEIKARLDRLAFCWPSVWDHLHAPSRLPPQLSTHRNGNESALRRTARSVISHMLRPNQVSDQFLNF